jgi:hypothetical protein
MKISKFAVIIAMVALAAIVTGIIDFGTATSIAWAPVAFERNLFDAIQRLDIAKNTKPEPSFLRIEKTLVDGQGSYDFNLKVESGMIGTERKLDRNDVFCATHLCVYLIKQKTAEIGKEVPQTYPNQQVFTSASAYDLTDLQAIYNGFMWIKTEQTVNAEAIPMLKFLHIPETQQSSAANYSQFKIEEHAYYPGGIVFVFKGWSSIEIKIQFPTWSGITLQTGESGYVTKLVFMPFGFLLKSAIQQSSIQQSA